MAQRRALADQRQGGLYAWIAWSLGVLFAVFVFAVQTGYAVTSPDVGDSLGLTAAQIGLVAAFYTWVFAIFQVWAGGLLDILGARLVITAAILIVSAGVFIFSISQSLTGLLLAQALLALGACFGFVGAGFIGADWFGVARFSVMFGLVQFFVSVVAAFHQNVVSAVLDHIGWRQLHVYLGSIGVALAVAFVAVFRDSSQRRSARSEHSGVGSFWRSYFAGLGAVATTGRVWLAAVSGGFTFAAVLALGVLLAPVVFLAHGATEVEAALGSSMVWIGLAIGSLVVPWVSERFRTRKRVIALGVLGQIFTLLLLALLPSDQLLLLYFVTLVFGFCGAVVMIAFAAAADVVAPTQIGQASALANAVMFIAGGVLLSVPAWIVADRHWVRTDLMLGLAPVIGALVVALAVAVSMRDTYPRGSAGQER